MGEKERRDTHEKEKRGRRQKENIMKARALEETWELNIECRKFLKDNEKNWIEHREEMEKLKLEELRQEKLKKAKGRS